MEAIFGYKGYKKTVLFCNHICLIQFGFFKIKHLIKVPISVFGGEYEFIDVQ